MDRDNRQFKSWQIWTGIACIILGILIVILFRAHEKEDKGTYSSDLTTELAGIIENSEHELDKMQAELLSQREQLNRFEQFATEGQSLLKALSQELLKARLEAGFIAVKGDGIVVTLNDSNTRAKVNEDVYFYLIHDTDLRDLITELWSAGAEAISINDQRVVTSTSIRCVGPAILVNAQPLIPPYSIKAIGPAAKLETALTVSGGYMDNRALSIRKGINIKITKSKSLKIPAYNDALIFQYAKPDNEGGSKLYISSN